MIIRRYTYNDLYNNEMYNDYNGIDILNIKNEKWYYNNT